MDMMRVFPPGNVHNIPFKSYLFCHCAKNMGKHLNNLKCCSFILLFINFIIIMVGDTNVSLTRTAFKRKMMDMGFSLADFPDEVIIYIYI